MHSLSATVIPELTLALDDSDGSVQLEAVQALRFFGPQASPAVDRLRRLLREGSTEVRTEAALTLSTVGHSARTASDELVGTMRGDESGVARQAAATLVQLGLNQDEALTRLDAFLKTRDIRFRTRTADIVGSLGPAAESVVPSLLGLLENDDPRDDRTAVLALRNIKPSAIPEKFRRGRSGSTLIPVVRARPPATSREGEADEHRARGRSDPSSPSRRDPRCRRFAGSTRT
jgi:HEAT repeat protein